MPQRSNNPLEDHNFSQQERDRVMQKYETLSNLYGHEKAEKLLTAKEMQIMLNTMANRALEEYDERLALIAMEKIRKAIGGKATITTKELTHFTEKLLNTDEKAALIGMMTKKARESKDDTSGYREIKN